ncbi:MAG TPA: phosphatase PAP2 family protein, partial [Polyangiaceae bacterium]|nr:phosphatase PAP2 family protein [Polyangiaceae bacterium]
FTKVYMHDYMWMVVLAFIFYVRRDRFSLRWLFASVTLVYILGVLITMLYPSYGPCFLEPGRFSWIRETTVGRTQANLAQFYDLSVKTVNAEGAFRAAAFMGIAAFPSLHVAHMVILVMIAWRTFPLYSVWMLWMTIATTIATIGFGWHYIVDALGGIVLAVLVTELLYRYYRRAPKATAIAPPNET